jgi:hypothetical protein
VAAGAVLAGWITVQVAMIGLGQVLDRITVMVLARAPDV